MSQEEFRNAALALLGRLPLHGELGVAGLVPFLGTAVTRDAAEHEPVVPASMNPATAARPAPECRPGQCSRGAAVGVLSPEPPPTPSYYKETPTRAKLKTPPSKK